MRLTVEGRKFLLLNALIGVAAFNTGNNLIYLIFAMLLSILLVSLLSLVINTRGLSLEVSVLQPVFAGEAAELQLMVRNRKRFLDSHSIRVILPKGFEGTGYLPLVPAGSEAIGKAEVTFKRRGIYRYGDFRLGSGYPFVFFSRSVRAAVEGEVLVYPELTEVGQVVWPLLRRGEGGTPTIRPGAGEEILDLRELRHGEDVKLVSWRASAKAGRLMVREFQEEGLRLATVVLDDVAPRDPAAFERAVSVTASVCKALMEEGFMVKLVTCAKVIPAGAGTAHMDRMLELLALVEETEMDDCVVEETKGLGVLVLKSPGSPLSDRAGMFDAVVNAGDL